MSDIIKGWRHSDQRYNLIGTKCNKCGCTFFPKKVVCPNCRSHGEIEDIQFKGTGKIYTYSIIHSATDDFKNNSPYSNAFWYSPFSKKVNKTALVNSWSSLA